ncbi:hypothetical protein C8Q75DRAFT_807916 [Abortiporus biennis]|nr:hypothetical protein C8Q75DRAFT_807916 [Abortiporus biennis]
MALLGRPIDICQRCRSIATIIVPCSVCRLIYYCSEECREIDKTAHLAVCVEAQASITGVRLVGGHDRPFEATEIQVPRDHPVWNNINASEIPQMTKYIACLLKVYREEPALPLATPRIAEKDNQSVTDMMIFPENGIIPPLWQKNIGPVIVVHADKRPLPKPALEIIWQFCRSINRNFENGDVRLAKDRSNPETFENFCEEYKEQNMRTRPEEFQNLEFPF